MRWLWLVLLVGCTRVVSEHDLVKINIIDRNGMNETIQAKDRLARYQGVDFLRAQPYQKVLRVCGQKEDGAVLSYVTSYHENGQVSRYLEVVDGRASGMYREWHSNGQLKLEARVVGGAADIDEGAQQTYVFEGVSRAWDEKGCLAAEIPYVGGVLEGVCRYFGGGELVRSERFAGGVLDGEVEEFWPGGMPAVEEQFVGGLLVEGRYFDEEGVCVGEVRKGKGVRVVFGGGGRVLYDFARGRSVGRVREFGKRGELVRVYCVRDGVKEGEEIEYYWDLFGEEQAKKLALTWRGGEIQGVVRTWYENGQIESQREMSHNVKNGMCTAWYQDGSLMFIEEYREDRLMKGEYYEQGASRPASRVKEGSGMASLFDAQGNFLARVTYVEGSPIE
jgi:antitoxin component YwqK of YwqJK toxin-antitoxin module